MPLSPPLIQQHFQRLLPEGSFRTDSELCATLINFEVKVTSSRVLSKYFCRCYLKWGINKAINQNFTIITTFVSGVSGHPSVSIHFPTVLSRSDLTKLSVCIRVIVFLDRTALLVTVSVRCRLLMYLTLSLGMEAFKFDLQQP